MRPGTSDANGSPVSSGIGSASMSPRSRIVGPGFAPFSVATTDVVLLPVFTSSPAVDRLEHGGLCLRQGEAELGLAMNPPAELNGVVEKVLGLG
jgi:hypothetical protein